MGHCGGRGDGVGTADDLHGGSRYGAGLDPRRTKRSDRSKRMMQRMSGER